MKIKFKYINKRLLAGIMAGTIAFSTVCCGCGAQTKYVEISDGVYELSNSIAFDHLKSYQLVEMEVDGKVELYIARKKSKIVNNYISTDNSYLDMYHNVLNDEIIYTVYEDPQKENNKGNNVENKNTLLKEENIFDYLVAYNEIQDFYTKEDLERILGKIKEDWDFTVQKENSKEKSKIKE